MDLEQCKINKKKKKEKKRLFDTVQVKFYCIKNGNGIRKKLK